MNDDRPNDSHEEARRRFDIDIFIVHPTMTPAEITAALKLEPQHSLCVGEGRTAPIGTQLDGVYPDTRWRHKLYFVTNDQWFSGGIDEMMEILAPHKSFFTRVRETGGTAGLVVQFLGDGYLGDVVPRKTLAKMVELQLDLSIECFAVPQNE